MFELKNNVINSVFFQLVCGKYNLFSVLLVNMYLAFIGSDNDDEKILMVLDVYWS